MATQETRELTKQDLEKWGYKVLHGPFDVFKGPSLLDLLVSLARKGGNANFRMQSSSSFKFLCGGASLTTVSGLRRLGWDDHEWLVEGHFGQVLPGENLGNHWFVAKYSTETRTGEAFITEDPKYNEIFRLPKEKKEKKKKK